MPYELKENTAQCDGWGVYKQETGELIAGGCHVNKPDALAHLAALEIATQNEGRAAEGDDFTMSKTEYRATVAEFTPDVADGFTYRGHIALFDSPSSPSLGFTEVIKRGAFAKSLAAATQKTWEVKAYQDHKPELFLGSTKTGTLSLVEDSLGLLAEIRLNPAVSYASDLAANLRRDGAAMGASFGFSVPAKGEVVSEDGTTRELVNVRLHEVSLLTGNEPAYPATVGLGAVRALAKATNHEAVEVRDAVDALLAGDINPERAAFLRAILGEIAEEEKTATDAVETVAQEPAASGGVPVSVRELQLALERLKR